MVQTFLHASASSNQQRSTMLLPLHDDFVLDELTWDDVPSLARHINEPEISANTLTIPYPYTEEDARKFIRNILEERTKLHAPMTLAIRNNNGDVIGMIGLILNPPPFLDHQAEIGYWINSHYRSRGLATMAVQAIVKFAFEVWKFRKVTARTYTTNPASARVLLKAGFKEEGLLRQHYRKNGQYLDCRVFGILDREWKVGQ